MSIFLISNFSSIQYNAGIAYHRDTQMLVMAVHVGIVHGMRERTNATGFGTTWSEIDAGIILDIAGSESVLFARDRVTLAVKI